MTQPLCEGRNNTTCAVIGSSAVGDRPHILIAMVDQLSARFLRAYGHPVTKTPTIDRLAEGGVVVRNLPGTSLLRASVGAWNDDADLERLLAAL